MLLAIFGTLFTLCVLFGLGFFFSKTVFMLLIWLVVKLPITLIFMAFGIVLCCTIFLIPLGVMCFKIAGGMLVPAV